MNIKFRALGLALMASSTLFVQAACVNQPVMREQVAHRIASPAWMIPRKIPAAPFVLTAYEKMHEHNAPADVYIEGDGLAWLSRNEASLDPTPTNPVALNLAAMDNARNVAYLARPCQFTKMQDEGTACPSKYWTSQRFAPEVLESMNAALDNIKRQYDITEFNLIGFSGGANIASLLAAKRPDVVSLRTVSGNLDHRALSEYHKVSYLENSLSALDVAAKLEGMPQRHFIGGQDDIVPPSISAKFAQAVGSDRCLDVTLIQEAEHEEGWADKWPELLAMPVACKTPKTPEPAFEPYTPPKKVEREKPEKP